MSDSTEIADHLDAFIGYVGDYMGAEQLYYMAEPGPLPAPGSLAESALIDHMESLAHRYGDARNVVLREGRKLSAILSRVGVDPEPVLRCVNNADRGGGADGIREHWHLSKIAMQKASIRMRQGEWPAERTSEREARLTPTEGRAHQSYAVAEAAGAETDDAAYDHIDLHGCPQYESVELPTRDTWKRQLRRARRKLREPKNTPRAGRTGRSIAGPGR